VTENDNIFVIAWCSEGLEAILDVKECDMGDTMLRLQGNPANTLRTALNYLLTRARYNHQRVYEIYSIHTAPNIDEKTLTLMFEENPQVAADLIRKRGTVILSQRDPNKVRIQ